MGTCCEEVEEEGSESSQVRYRSVGEGSHKVFVDVNNGFRTYCGELPACWWLWWLPIGLRMGSFVEHLEVEHGIGVLFLYTNELSCQVAFGKGLPATEAVYVWS
ncbi:hypothetical protein Droror1_Dr00026913 [Drosera rotundifolia]